jgi:uncharacterized Zn finger protein
MTMSYYNNYPPYVSVAERKAKADKKLKQLKKKNPKIKPVIIEGNTLAKNWWGKAWNKNLEKYADYANRIGRGRSYVRHGSVLDLQIEPNRIKATVAGSRSKPYTVEIHIKAVPKKNWMRIRKKCEGQLDSLQELLAGKFPKELQEIFTAKGEGLFPSPKEISFDCSCPDWASMCKHVSATLYGIGARLDEDPELFFKLRNATIKDLISQAVSAKTNKLLNQSKKKSQKALDDTDLSDLFGIDLEETPKVKTAKKNAPNLPKPVVGGKTKPLRQKKVPKIQLVKSSTIKAKGLPPIDLVKKVILKSKNGVKATEIEQKTGLERKKIYALVHQLKKACLIKNKSQGVYIKN